MVKTIKTASRGEGKTAKPDFARWKYTPFGANAPPFPRRGALLPALCLALLMRANTEWRANFPLRVEVPRSGDRGAFPTGAAWSACFPFAPKARLYDFTKRGGPL